MARQITAVQIISTIFRDLDVLNKVQQACIIIPTYNEAENIVPVLEEIFHNEYVNRERGIEINVLVVDDNSPDGTADKVKDFQKWSSNGLKVMLLQRENKEGLGAAYIAGMKYALDKTDADVIFEMDADGQHNPGDIYPMIDAIEEGYDFALGSRYVDGGSVPQNWGFKRKFVSACASTITRVGLGLKGIRDCSGGFRAMRREVLETIDLDSLSAKGYAFQAALLEAALHAGFDVKEVPISFGERTNGDSKMTFKDMMEGWKLIYVVRMQRLKRALFN